MTTKSTNFDDHGTTLSTYRGTDVPVFVDMYEITNTGEYSVSHDTVITKQGTVIPRLQGASLAGFLTQIEKSGAN